MPHLVTLGDLRLAAQQICDMENSDFISTAEWNRMLADCWEDLFAAVADTGLRYFETSVTWTAQSNIDTYDEPVDFYQTCAIYRVDSSGRIYPLREIMAQEEPFYRGLSGSDAIAYMHLDSELTLFPNPQSGTYQWRYVYRPYDFTTAADSFRIDVCVPDGRSFVVYAAAAMACIKEESDSTVLRQERDVCRERVADWASKKNLNSNRRVVQDPGGLFGDSRLDPFGGLDDWGG